MGAVGLNGVAQDEGRDETATARIASKGWAMWMPVNAAAIAAHLAGASGLLAANRARVRYQQGVLASSITKATLTVAAVGASVYAGVLGSRVGLATSDTPEAQEAAEAHPVDLPQAQKQLAAVQWAVPALTAALVTVTALQGEQQRPAQQKKGLLRTLAAKAT